MYIFKLTATERRVWSICSTHQAISNASPSASRVSTWNVISSLNIQKATTFSCTLETRTEALFIFRRTRRFWFCVAWNPNHDLPDAHFAYFFLVCVWSVDARQLTHFLCFALMNIAEAKFSGGVIIAHARTHTHVMGEIGGADGLPGPRSTWNHSPERNRRQPAGAGK